MNTTGVAPAYSYMDEDMSNLNKLVETFSSSFSLQDIASAYTKSGRNLQSASDILCSMKQSAHDTSALDLKKCAKGTSNASYGSYSHAAKTKPKKCSASLGTVSNVIGKEYITPKPQATASCQKQKSVLLTSDDVPESAIWQGEEELTAETESMNRDLQEFVCEMLGDGFGLDKNLIQDVIGQCGYNMQMSIDKLLDLSAAPTEKSKDVSGSSSGNFTGQNLADGFDMKSVTQSQPKVDVVSERPSGSSADVINHEEVKPKSKKDLQREVLEALFTLPDRTEEKPRLKGRETVDKDSPYIVTGLPKETLIEDFTFITRQPVSTETNESIYEELCEAAKENWQLMKQYYEAAVDSFKNEDYVKAQNLMEKGHLHMNKAREAEEKSHEKLFNDCNISDDFILNLYHLEPRDAMRTLRLHLKTLCGLSSIQCIKAVVGTEGGGKKDRRRKNLIIELLENEGILWTEEGNGFIISVRADVIDPRKLSFANK